MIDLSIHKEGLAHNIRRAKENGVVIPTYAQMKDPSKIPQSILDKLAGTGLWDVDPVNLFRVSWHNEPKESGGLFGTPNYIEFPCFTADSIPMGIPIRDASTEARIPILILTGILFRMSSRTETP